jgi:uncharacterized membrane protein YdjX (TVP38/TMEM64 family)
MATVSIKQPVILLIIVLITLLAAYLIADQSGWIDIILDQTLLKSTVHNAGIFGILIIIGLMVIAIIFNPIPSAPIALVAGALYGHTWGTVYIVIGALAGAVIAFTIARITGRSLIVRLLGEHTMPSWIGSQNSMMMTVLLSRLVPFISFDLISYGAGLTSLKLWRFSIATLIGLLPASFLLAHFGSEMTADNLNESMSVIFLAGILLLLPVIFGLAKLLKRAG